MFWRKKQPKAPAAPPQIGCFGKLPATGDFVRLNAGGDEVACSIGGSAASIDFARRSMGPAFDEAYPHAVGLFIYHGEGRGEGRPPAARRRLVASGDNAGRLSR